MTEVAAPSEEITVGSAGPDPEKDIPDGVYVVTLVDIKVRGPYDSKQQGEPAFYMRDWIFAVEAPGTDYHERLVEISTSMAAGPKSKQYGVLVALNNGVPLATGQKFGKSDLVARQALGTVNHNDEGYPKITNLSALPTAMRGNGKTSAAKPAAEPAADNIPF